MSKVNRQLMYDDLVDFLAERWSLYGTEPLQDYGKDVIKLRPRVSIRIRKFLNKEESFFIQEWFGLSEPPREVLINTECDKVYLVIKTVDTIQTMTYMFNCKIILETLKIKPKDVNISFYFRHPRICTYLSTLPLDEVEFYHNGVIFNGGEFSLKVPSSKRFNKFKMDMLRKVLGIEYAKV